MGYQKTVWANGGTPAINATNLSKIEAGIEQAGHTGDIKMWPTKWAPTGWLERNGAAISRTTYADLYDAMTHPQTFTVTIASPAVFSATAHKFTAGDPVRVSTTGALPTGLSATVTYYVIAAGLTADAFEVSTGVGGAAVNTSGSQNGTHTVRYFGVVGVGDGSTTFTLPDDRGYVERGWDNGRGVDTGRVFGSYQADGNKTHTHPGTTGNENATHGHTVDSDPIQRVSGSHSYVLPVLMASFSASYDNEHPLVNMTTGAESATHGHPFTTDASGNTEVTVKNVAYMPIIKY